jgi:hypothetical protein
MVFGIKKKIREGILPVLEAKLEEDEKERLVKTWNEATDEKKAAYKKDAKKLLKDVGISKKSMRKVRKGLL